MDIQDIVKLTRGLSPKEKLKVCSAILNCGEDECDNEGQLVLYTGLYLHLNGSLHTEKEELPADYELCSSCGYDHSYEYTLAAKYHKDNDK